MNKLTNEIYKKLTLLPEKPSKYIVWCYNIYKQGSQQHIYNGEFGYGGHYTFIADEISWRINNDGRKRHTGYLVELKCGATYYHLFISFSHLYGKIEVYFMSFPRVCEKPECGFHY